MTFRQRTWRAIVKRIGGFSDIGRASICAHDNGLIFAWDRVIKWEWRA